VSLVTSLVGERPMLRVYTGLSDKHGQTGKVGANFAGLVRKRKGGTASTQRQGKE
jgi:hypothetical protein